MKEFDYSETQQVRTRVIGVSAVRISATLQEIFIEHDSGYQVNAKPSTKFSSRDLH